MKEKSRIIPAAFIFLSFFLNFFPLSVSSDSISVTYLRGEYGNLFYVPGEVIRLQWNGVPEYIKLNGNSLEFTDENFIEFYAPDNDGINHLEMKHKSTIISRNLYVSGLSFDIQSEKNVYELNETVEIKPYIYRWDGFLHVEKISYEILYRPVNPNLAGEYLNHSYIELYSNENLVFAAGELFSGEYMIKAKYMNKNSTISFFIIPEHIHITLVSSGTLSKTNLGNTEIFTIPQGFINLDFQKEFTSFKLRNMNANISIDYEKAGAKIMFYSADNTFYTAFIEREYYNESGYEKIWSPLFIYSGTISGDVRVEAGYAGNNIRTFVNHITARWLQGYIFPKNSDIMGQIISGQNKDNVISSTAMFLDGTSEGLFRMYKIMPPGKYAGVFALTDAERKIIDIRYTEFELELPGMLPNYYLKEYDNISYMPVLPSDIKTYTVKVYNSSNSEFNYMTDDYSKMLFKRSDEFYIRFDDTGKYRLVFAFGSSFYSILVDVSEISIPGEIWFRNDSVPDTGIAGAEFLMLGNINYEEGMNILPGTYLGFFNIPGKGNITLRIIAYSYISPHLKILSIENRTIKAMIEMETDAGLYRYWDGELYFYNNESIQIYQKKQFNLSSGEIRITASVNNEIINETIIIPAIQSIPPTMRTGSALTLPVPMHIYTPSGNQIYGENFYLSEKGRYFIYDDINNNGINNRTFIYTVDSYIEAVYSLKVSGKTSGEVRYYENEEIDFSINLLEDCFIRLELYQNSILIKEIIPHKHNNIENILFGNPLEIIRRTGSLTKNTYEYKGSFVIEEEISNFEPLRIRLMVETSMGEYTSNSDIYLLRTDILVTAGINEENILIDNDFVEVSLSSVFVNGTPAADSDMTIIVEETGVSERVVRTYRLKTENDGTSILSHNLTVPAPSVVRISISSWYGVYSGYADYYMLRVENKINISGIDGKYYTVSEPEMPVVINLHTDCNILIIPYEELMEKLMNILFGTSLSDMTSASIKSGNNTIMSPSDPGIYFILAHGSSDNNQKNMLGVMPLFITDIIPDIYFEDSVVKRNSSMKINISFHITELDDISDESLTKEFIKSSDNKTGLKIRIISMVSGAVIYESKYDYDIIKLNDSYYFKTEFRIPQYVLDGLCKVIVMNNDIIMNIADFEVMGGPHSSLIAPPPAYSHSIFQKNQDTNYENLLYMAVVAVIMLYYIEQIRRGFK